jgi:hypothetical protein
MVISAMNPDWGCSGIRPVVNLDCGKQELVEGSFKIDQAN